MIRHFPRIPLLFIGCESLEAVVLPDSLTRLGKLAFKDCSSLKEIVLPDTIEEIDTQGLFSSCMAPNGLTVPAGTAFFAKNALDDCASLRYVLFEDSGTEIEASAFSVPAFAYVMGKTGSAAEQYAKAYNRRFIATDNGYELPKTQTGDLYFRIAAQGDFADGLHWSHDIEGTLRITGSGAMPDINDFTKRFWFYSENVTDVIIGEDITVLGNNSFLNVNELKSVTILNLECEIHNNGVVSGGNYSQRNTICNNTGLGEGDFCLFYNGVIRGYAGSTAEEYARFCEVPFEVIGEEHTTPVPTTTSATATTASTSASAAPAADITISMNTATEISR